ncbi:carbohydrate kinase family protein [Natrarchaeobaculum aegyptiacum]|uniref:Carbohydrate kinase family protein n=1 Tax=Natrarchaeobaculum aegyptiacum TaxID=745377 RepID=A0A2Z2HT44_9EURY|nr:carbohydrate kinase family protein [Natrarchaeobaculum aegyptiacum]ARS90360.1 carbohydrate kinase family protein [Natrarchaeobaculum aegyptiacum]
MTGSPAIVSVGSALLDEQYLVSNLPRPDAGAFVREESVAFGGVAANVAVAVSRLGHTSGIVARLGNDDIAEMVTSDLHEEGVEIDRLRRSDDERSTYCMVFRDPDGERTIVTRSGAASALRLTDDDVSYLRSADVVFANGFCPDDVTRTVSRLAAEGTIRLAFDLASPLDALAGRATSRETVDGLLSEVSLFVANEASIRSYLGTDGRDAVERLRHRGVRRGALTQGEDGALLWTDEPDSAVVDVPALDVDVVDTTGAGDAFVAGLLHRWLLEGDSLQSAAEFATAGAGYNCTEPGARGGMVSEKRIARLVRDELQQRRDTGTQDS